jgi:peptidoglycan/xylan/chitin deacetylase (PgdA/CDA1 family)
MSIVVPVLLYHSVSDTPPPNGSRETVSPTRFAAHVGAVVTSGRQAITITTLAQALRRERSLPERPVAVTFDDGYDDTYAAVNNLCAQGIASTVYVTTGKINAPGRLTAQQITSLAQMPGVELASHGVRHRRLDELNDRELLEEAGPSKRLLEDLLGREVASFAYPHGAFNRRVQNAVLACGYRSAAAVKNALSHDADDPFAIARWTVTGAASGERVAEVLAGRGAPLAWHGERLRTRAYRAVRRQRRRALASWSPRC